MTHAPEGCPRPLRLEWVTADSLSDNPNNWRRHPALQTEALSGLLDEVGWAGALLFNETTNRLVDGHARKGVALNKGVAAVPVLVGRWSEAQEKKILATLDPIAALAETSPADLARLLNDVETGHQAINVLLAQLKEEAKVSPPAAEPEPTPPATPAEGAGGTPTGAFAVKVMCPTEERRGDLMASLRAEGYDCQPL